MITFKTGNIFEADVDVLVNTVNTTGVMGKGIALQFKKQFPDNFMAYKKAVENGTIMAGMVYIVPVNSLGKVKYVANFATKDHWRDPSRIEWIESGLLDLKKQLLSLSIKSVAIPPLGCGNGGLKWDIVKQLITNVLKDLPMEVEAYYPSDKIQELLQKEYIPTAGKLTQPRAMLLSLLYQYRALGEEVTEFAAEKLSYFLQNLGEGQLKLDFQKGYYGPYSGKVRHVLYVMNGYFIKGFEQKQAMPFAPLQLVVEKKPEVDDFIEKNLTSTQKTRLQQVARLIHGFETPYGLELLATTSFILSEGVPADAGLIKKEIDSWSDRKKDMFQKPHIDLAIKALSSAKAIVAG